MLWGRDQGSCVFSCMNINFSSIYRKNGLSALSCFGSFVRNKLTICVSVYIWTIFYFIDLLINLYVDIIPLRFCSFIVCLEIWQYVSFQTTVLAILGPLHFYVNFRISLSISMKNILLKFWLGLNCVTDNLGRTDILTPFRFHLLVKSYCCVYLSCSLFLSVLFCSFQGMGLWCLWSDLLTYL